MDNRLSHRIIGFLRNLAHFQDDTIDGQDVATRLTDGTIFLPPKELESVERGLLIVHWQGDRNRETIVVGNQIAALEIVVSIRHWVATGDMENLEESVKHMFQHYRVKTGETLYVNEPDGVVSKSMESLVKDLGWSAVKKMIGL